MNAEHWSMHIVDADITADFLVRQLNIKPCFVQMITHFPPSASHPKSSALPIV
jgi:hypothetical protein